jgi:hypothetical protein
MKKYSKNIAHYYVVNHESHKIHDPMYNIPQNINEKLLNSD